MMLDISEEDICKMKDCYERTIKTAELGMYLWPLTLKDIIDRYENNRKKTKEPLEGVDRIELQLNILHNIERKIFEMNDFEEGEGVANPQLVAWWRNTENWVKVQTFINGRSSKSGSVSSSQQCLFLGIDPGGKSLDDGLE